VLERRGGRILTHLFRKGEAIDPKLPVHDLPTAFLPFIKTYFIMGSREKLLLNYLKKFGNAYPILFKDGKKEVFVRWDDAVEAKAATELDVVNDEIRVTKCLQIGGKRKDHVLAGDLAFDLEAHTFYRIVDQEGWEVWKLLRDVLDDRHRSKGSIPDGLDGSSFGIGLKDFGRISFGIAPSQKKRFLEETFLRVDGRDAYAEATSPPEYALAIARGRKEEKIYFLRPERRMDPFAKNLSSVPFDFFHTLERGRYPSSLKARKRLEVLHRVFFQALTEKGEEKIEQLIRDSITPEVFERYRSLVEAKRILTETLARRSHEGFELHFEGNRWTLFPVDRRREGLLYAIPFEIFGSTIFEEGLRYGNQMAVREEDFWKGLPSLYRRLSDEKVRIFFEEQPLRLAEWECEVDATRSSIDWFELRPEIRCNGASIDEALLEKALSRGGVVERNGAIEILSEESLKRLKALYELVKGRRGVKREVVRIPRLQILDWILLRKNGVSVRLSPEDERIISRLARFQRIEQKPLPEGLRAILRGYQREGCDWLSFLYENRFGACLADDMGLGKTLQALSLLAGIREGMVESHNKFVHTHLIIVPPSLLFNWESEIERFYPNFKVYTYQGKERTVDFRGFDIVLTSYGLVRRDIDKLKDVHFDVVIFDEAQTIKNIYANTTGAVRQLKTSFKLALTGTPVENHIGEYYSIMDLVLPGLLGEYDLFKSQAKQEAASFFDIVIARTKPFILRRTKEETLRELPPKIETDFYLDLTEKQKGLYHKTIEAVKSTIDEAYRTKTAAQAKIIALTALLKLRQICLSPQLLLREAKEVSPKIEFLKARLTKLYDEGHHALVFSQFTSFLDLVEKEIQDHGFNLLRLDGSTPVKTRKRLVEGFQKSDHPTVFLLSLKAGGQGLNLTKATYVFHLDPWWNPAVESQASDRAHRIGQKNTVIITRILMKHTIEEKMMELKKRKLRLYKAILESPSQAGRLSIRKEDFEFLLNS